MLPGLHSARLTMIPLERGQDGIAFPACATTSNPGFATGTTELEAHADVSFVGD